MSAAQKYEMYLRGRPDLAAAWRAYSLAPRHARDGFLWRLELAENRYVAARSLRLALEAP